MQEELFLNEKITAAKLRSLMNQAVDDGVLFREDNTYWFATAAPVGKKTIQEVHHHFNSKVGRRTRLTPGRLKKIRSRLREYSPEQLKTAINAFFQSEWHASKENLCKIEWLFHNDERVDNFLTRMEYSRNGNGVSREKKSETQVRDLRREALTAKVLKKVERRRRLTTQEYLVLPWEVQKNYKSVTKGRELLGDIWSTDDV